MSLIGRLVLALVVAIVVGFVLAVVLGPLLVTQMAKIPIAVFVGGILVTWGWLLGILAGLWHFFAGNGWPIVRRSPPG